MADRYWVPGGSGTWGDATVTTNWASSSGGARIASPPAVGDSVFFDNNSGNPTVLVQGSPNLFNFFMSGPCTLTLGQNLSLSGSLINSAGSLNTSTFNLSIASVVNSTGILTRTLNLGSGTHSISGGNFTLTNTGLTFNAGTSTINLASNSVALSTEGLTFNNVSFASTNQSVSSISGANTFNNLTIAGRGSVGVNQFSITDKQIINGTLTLSAGALSPARTFIKSSVIGQQVELQVNSFAASNDIDFRDINITGSARPINGLFLRFGDCKGNDGINFPVAKEVFYRATAGNWGGTGAGSWSLTLGGAASVAAFPLAQDTATFPVSPTPYPTSGNTATINAAYNIGTINMSLRTSNTMTLAMGTQAFVLYGNLQTGTGTTYSGTGSSPVAFSGRGTQNITSSAKVFTRPISIDSSGGAVVLLDAFESNSTSDSSLVSGTWNLNGYTTTIRAHLIVTGSNTREIAFGGANLVIGILRPSGTVWDATASSNLTLSGGGTITLQTAASGGSAKTFAGGSYQNYPTVDLGANVTIYSTGLTVTGSNKFQNITNSTLQGGTLRFTGGKTNEFVNFSVTGVAGDPLTLSSTNTTQTTLRKSTTWFMGDNSTNVIGNTGLTFTAGDGIDYLVVSYINGIAGSITFTGTITETATGTDLIATAVTYTVSITEVVTGTDVISADFSGNVYAVTITETVTGTDIVVSSATFLASVVESALATDSLAIIVTLDAATAETATAADIAEAVAATFIAASIDEQTTAVDVVIVAPPTFNVSVAEVATALDSLEANFSYNVQFVDFATATDDVQSVVIFVGAVVEQATGSDAVEAIVAFATQVLEATTATDVTLVAPSVYGAQLAEAATALEALFTTGTFNVQFADTATVFDAVVGAYLWNPIDDSQTPNWQNIGTVQAPTWVDINNDQSPDWTQIPT